MEAKKNMKNNTKELLYFKNIGCFMKQTRMEHKKTQSFVGNILGCTFQQIQKYEKASNYIGKWKFILFCQKFNCDMGLVISQCLDNMYLPEQLIEEGKIQVTTVSHDEIVNDPNINLSPQYWIDKKNNDK